LTPGEVMQLPPTDELVLVSGMAPIRATKLRYYADRAFKDRVLPPPMLGTSVYLDRPAQRSDDWGRFARNPDARLARDDSQMPGEDDGGLQQQRHPGLGEEAASKASENDQGQLPGLADDDESTATDQRAMDGVRGLSTIARGYGLNGSSGRDLLPGL
jgi:type IV secretion system protein VirD4